MQTSEKTVGQAAEQTAKNSAEQSAYDVIVIGGGPGGYAAALYAVRAGLSTIVLEMFSAGGQMAETDKIDNYPGFNEGIEGFDLGERMAKGAENFGAETVFAEVMRVDFSQTPKVIETRDRCYTALAVIIATGAAPRRLDIEGEEMLRSRGVAYCASCDGMFYKGRPVAVVGSGNTAAGDALLLSNICSKVYFVHRYDMPHAEQAYLEILKNTPNVEFFPNSETTGFIFQDQKTVTADDSRKNQSSGGKTSLLKGITVTDTASGMTREILCDGVFAAVGRTPNTKLFEGQLDLTVQGYIMAEENTQTNIPGVFAVGDVRTKPVRQIITAAADGAVSAKFAEEYVFSERFSRTSEL